MSSAIAEPRYRAAGNDPCYLVDGARLPRVTSIIDLLGREHLMIWHGKMAAEESAALMLAALDGQIALEDAQAGIIDVDARKIAGLRERDRKGAMGSLTHHAFYARVMGDSIGNLDDWLAGEAVALGLADPARDTGGEPYAVSLARMARPYAINILDWLDRAKPRIHSVGLEACVVSRRHQYAGTCDLPSIELGLENAHWHARSRLVGPAPRRIIACCADIKTSNAVDPLRHYLQISAYAYADEIVLMQDGSRHAIPETEYLAVIHVTPFGVEIHAFPRSTYVYERFLDLRRLWDFVHPVDIAPSDRRNGVRGGKYECPF